MEQNDPKDELAWSFRFDSLAKGGQGLRVTLGIHCCPALQGNLSEGGRLAWAARLVMQVKICDVREAKEGLENEL